ncbi:probable serine/threonine-protein kinase kinX isoform X3 [Paralichthys olivaceus]
MDPVEELNPPEPKQMRMEEASTDDNEYVSQDMELKEWLEWLHDKYNIPEPQQKRMEGASTDDDKYVSQDMELEEWLEWLHEKYRTPEPQQMRMEEASTAVNRCVSEDMEFEEWVDWMAAQYEPPDPQQMNSSVTEEEDIDEWIDWMAEQYDSTVAEAHESPSDLNVLQSNTVTKPKRSRMDPVEELNPPEPQQMRMEEASTDDNEYVSQDMELKEWLEWLHEKYNIPEPQQKRMEGASNDDDEYHSQDMELEEWLEWLHEKYRTPEPQQMRMDEAPTAVNRCVSEDMEFEEWVDWMAAQYEPPDPQQMNSSVTEEEDIDEWIDWMAEQYDSTVAEAHESPSDLNVLPEKQNGKLQTDIANNSKTVSLVSPGSLLSLDKRSPEGCTSEKLKTISDSKEDSPERETQNKVKLKEDVNNESVEPLTKKSRTDEEREKANTSIKNFSMWLRKVDKTHSPKPIPDQKASVKDQMAENVILRSRLAKRISEREMQNKLKVKENANNDSVEPPPKRSRRDEEREKASNSIKNLSMWLRKVDKTHSPKPIPD